MVLQGDFVPIKGAEMIGLPTRDNDGGDDKGVAVIAGVVLLDREKNRFTIALN
jgi:hypothetical protein